MTAGTTMTVPTPDPGHASGARWFGVYPALVIDIVDPDGQGRVKISLPWSPDQDGSRYEAWARLATLMAGPGRGSWFIPELHDEVLVSFEAGDPRRPYVLGGLWNGSDAPPESMDAAGENFKKVIRTRSGVTLTLDDTDGDEQLVLETPGGQRVTLTDGPGAITIEDANGNTIRLEAAGVTITSAAKLTVEAATAELSAATLSVNAGMSTFSGVVQAQTVITNSVISGSYTPGVGNIW